MKKHYKKREQIYIDENVIEHKENEGKNLILGWATIGVDCNPKCPEPTPQGYYQCISGNCIFFPTGIV